MKVYGSVTYRPLLIISTRLDSSFTCRIYRGNVLHTSLCAADNTPACAPFPLIWEAVIRKRVIKDLKRVCREQASADHGTITFHEKNQKRRNKDIPRIVPEP